MPVLKNPKHELFAQALAEGLSLGKAHKKAGYSGNHTTASTLSKTPTVSKRVTELLEQKAKIELLATERAVQKIAISKEKIMQQLAAIGFSDIRKVVQWRGVTVMQRDADGEEVEVHVNDVGLIDSELVDDITAAAITEVKKTKDSLSVKMADKTKALMDLARMSGYVIDKKEVGAPGEFDHIEDPHELRRILSREATALGISPSEDAGGAGGRRGKPH